MSAAQLAYWCDQLSDLPPAHELPGDHPRRAIPSAQADRLRVDLDPSLDAALRALARRERKTLFMVMLAGFMVLIARHTGALRFLLGSGVAGRRPRATASPGDRIVSTVALSADLTGAPDVRMMLARARAVVLGAQAHPSMPLETIVREIQPDRDVARSPLFRMAFSFRDAPEHGLERHRVAEDGDPIASDLDAVVEPRVGDAGTGEDPRLTMTWSYDAALYARATIERLWDGYRRVLRGMVADPDALVLALPLLGDDAQRRLRDWNATAAPASPDARLVDWIASQAAHRADAPAVVEHAEAAGAAPTITTYGALVRRARQLAHRLRADGLAPEDRVAIGLPRGADSVVAQLAVLMAGGAYLPLDPAYPAARLGYVLDDSGARFLITRDDFDALQIASADGAGDTPIRIALDAEADALAAQPDAPIGAVQTPDRLAYVIYTSGSTGQPKGVMVSRGSLTDMVAWHGRTHALTGDDRAALTAGLAFDAAAWELWPNLAAGVALHVPPPTVRDAPERLRDWLIAHDITITFLATPILDRLLGAPWPAGGSLRRVLTGGDRLNRCPSADVPFDVVNHYGPTEATVMATAGPVPVAGTAAADDVGVPTIGRPVANHRVHLLDATMQPSPIGAVGEAYLAGAGLARGYIGRPGLTAARFVPDPFADAPGARLYRTGDLARWRRDGELIFHGRNDHQIQLRGLRVELQEIEMALNAHPSVQEAAVRVWGDEPETQFLVGYVVPRAASTFEEETLLTWLASQLPAPMVPGQLRPVERALPLTPNGKIDRAALPAPARGAAASRAPHVAPRSDMEDLLAVIWCDVLPLERVGVHDHFFRVGGHSLIATRLIARLRDHLELEVPLKLIFDHPVLADMAAAVETHLLAVLEAEDGMPDSDA
ncbi:MAG: amino acid adenylation domain-containing protein [Acidobacteriota bacterium]